MKCGKPRSPRCWSATGAASSCWRASWMARASSTASLPAPLEMRWRVFAFNVARGITLGRCLGAGNLLSVQASACDRCVHPPTQPTGRRICRARRTRISRLSVSRTQRKSRLNKPVQPHDVPAILPAEPEVYLTVIGVPGSEACLWFSSIPLTTAVSRAAGAAEIAQQGMWQPCRRSPPRSRGFKVHSGCTRRPWVRSHF